MQKVFLLLGFVLYLHASYNPFFDEPKTDMPKTQPSKPVPPVSTQLLRSPVEVQKLNLDLIYYGYVEAKRVSYALLKHNSQAFIIAQGDSFFVDNQKIDILDISSNRILVKFASTHQTFYFTRDGE